MEIKGRRLEKLIDASKIEKRVRELAEAIKNDFQEEDEIIVIGVLKGAFIFTADLSRYLGNKVKIDFLKVSSYGDKMESSRDVKFLMDISEDIENKNVLLVDDIIDTGRTLQKIVEKLKARNPKSLKTCVLLDKKERREVDFHADFVGFEIPDKFVVGYGLDWAEEGRNLKDIYIVV
jgi:hypoxanthine phosphoribosyltransferase